MRYCPACKATYLSLTTCPRDGVRVTSERGDPLIGETLGGRYRIQERIGAGGMGQVYRAAHARIASQFAVKVLFGDLAADREMRSRFEGEAESASVLQSRYITRVLDFGETERGVLYLVMELLEGQTLTDLLAREQRLPARRALKIARQVALGLAHAHERGIVHRDMKPDNVMLVTEDDAEEVAKILDFGIARMRTRTGLTMVGTVMGTPQYMAPEQFTGSDVDARADLYSLGIVLYEALVGRPPFNAPVIPELYQLHANAAVPEVAGATDGAVAPVLAALLGKRPEQRFASARAAVEAIDRALTQSPATLPPRVAVTVSKGPEVPGTVRRAPPSLEIGARIRAAIQAGAPLYNAGDHAGCAAVYRDAAEGLVSGPLGAGGEEAITARLSVALRRAAEATLTNAAWELRYAFDDLLHVASHPPVVGEVEGLAAGVKDPRWLSWQLAVAAQIAAHRQEAGAPSRAVEYLAAVADSIRSKLAAEGGAQEPVRALKAALEESARQPVSQALATLSAVLEALRARPVRVPTGARGEVRTTSLSRVPELGRAVEAIIRAIQTGAAAYNQGDIAGCARLYVDTAERIVSRWGQHSAGFPLRDALSPALSFAGTSPSADETAWALRHAFDAILAAANEGS